MTDSPADRPYNRVRDVAEGMAIFHRYGGKDVSAEHDILACGQPHGVALTEEDRDALLIAGWFQQSEFCECENVDEDDPKSHDLTCNEWGFFT